MANLLGPTRRWSEQRLSDGDEDHPAIRWCVYRGNCSLLKIEPAGSISPPAPFALAAFVRGGRAARASRANLEICAYVDERLPSRLISDAGAAASSVQLAGNATSSTKPPVVSIVVRRGAAPDEIVFAVRDTDRHRSRTIARFFLEFDKPTLARHEIGGSGLGLTISQRIRRVARAGAKSPSTAFPVKARICVRCRCRSERGRRA